jgi:hypothetical protein
MDRSQNPAPNPFRSRGMYRSVTSSEWVPRSYVQRLGLFLIGAIISIGSFALMASTTLFEAELTEQLQSKTAGVIFSFVLVFLVLAAGVFGVVMGIRLLRSAFRGGAKPMSMIVLTVAIFAICIWFAQHLSDRRKAAEREVYYQTILTRYTGALKPGMSRKQVEQYLRADGRQFGQMCCVAEFKGEHVSLVGAGWDDLIKIGEESAPWFCDENNVYIAFEFNPKSQSEQSGTSESDVLKRVSVFHQLQRCL